MEAERPPAARLAALEERREAASRRLARLEERRAMLDRDLAATRARLADLNARLGRADAVADAIEQLTEGMFAGLLRAITERISAALVEVLGQPLELVVDYKYHAAHGLQIEFAIQRDGAREDLLRGQGGSVTNVVSVGLRLFALVTLDEARHRPFLLLDEQDCWLRPDLVPAFVRIVREAADRLGLQTLMISHHQLEFFDDQATVIHRFRAEGGRIVVDRQGPRGGAGGLAGGAGGAAIE
jgi:hypothetical protein